MTRFADIVVPELLVPRLNADTKIAAIKELVDRLHAYGAISDSLTFLQAVLERETLESTILSGNVAIPHARIHVVNRLSMALGVTAEVMDFPSGDERSGVRLICLIAVPIQEPQSYLALLGTIARTFNQPDLKDRLLKAESADGLFSLLSSRVPTNTQ